MRGLTNVLAFLSLVVGCIGPAGADTVMEISRTPIYFPTNLSVNTADGSVWVTQTRTSSSQGTEGGQLLHLDRDGDVIWESTSFQGVGDVAASSLDGSCWATGTHRSQFLARLDKQGDEVLREWPPGTKFFPHRLAVNPSDGSCWVGASAHYPEQSVMVHMAADGSEIWRGGNFPLPLSVIAVTVNPADGSCWASGADMQKDAAGISKRAPGVLVHLDKDGRELWRGGKWGNFSPRGLSVNPSDGSIWASDRGDGDGRVVRLSEKGALLAEVTALEEPYAVAVDPGTGRCWVTGHGDEELVLLQGDGSIIWRKSFARGRPYDLSLAADGSCWVTVLGGADQVMHFGMVHTDLLSAAAEFSWRNGLHEILPFPGTPGDEAGRVSIGPARLENGSSHDRVLHTQLGSGERGLIQGSYKLSVPAGARFRARVGFIHGADKTDGALCRVIWYDGREAHVLADVGKRYDGRLAKIDADLSSFAGQDGHLIFGTHRGASSDDDHLIWVAPRIEQTQ